MKLSLFLFGMLSLLLLGCGGAAVAAVRSAVDVEVINRSSHVLEDAHARFGVHRCDWGNVGKTFTAGYGFYPHPITPEAELHWDEDGKHRMEKLDLKKIYPKGKSGRLTFIVHDGRVEVTFREKS